MRIEPILRKVTVKGSDGLVYALYRRVRADDTAGSACVPVDRSLWSWAELADRAVAEGVLTPGEARLLRALLSRPDEAVPAGPASPHTSSMRQREAS